MVVVAFEHPPDVDRNAAEKKKTPSSGGKTQTSPRIEALAVSTSRRVHDDFLRLLFLHAHREASALAGELPEESDHFRLLAAYLANLQRPVGLILAEASANFTIPLDISTRPFMSFPPFFLSHRAPPSSYSFPSLIS